MGSVLCWQKKEDVEAQKLEGAEYVENSFQTVVWNMCMEEGDASMQEGPALHEAIEAKSRSPEFMPRT